MNLANNIKNLRLRMGWSQDDLATKLSVSRGKISSYELRGVQPRLPLLTKMAKLFDVSIDQLVFDEFGLEDGEEESISIHGISTVDLDAVLLEERTKHQEEHIKHLNEIIRLKDELLQHKQAEVDLLRLNTANTPGPDETNIQVGTYEGKGKFLNWKTIKIPTDHYVEIADGVFDRSISSPDDLIFEWEKPFATTLESLDFRKHRVILNKSLKGARFEKHYHPEHEKLFCAQGAIKDTISGDSICAGEYFEFEPFSPHETLFLEDALVVVCLEY